MFRLQLEPLETREVPAALTLTSATESRDGADYSAIAFVGGWGSSMYQYAHSDPIAASVPTDQFSINFAKIEFDRSAPPPASDYLLVLDGVKGETRDGHRETIEIASWSLGATRAPARATEGIVVGGR